MDNKQDKNKEHTARCDGDMNVKEKSKARKRDRKYWVVNLVTICKRQYGKPEEIVDI